MLTYWTTIFHTALKWRYVSKTVGTLPDTNCTGAFISVAPLKYSTVKQTIGYYSLPLYLPHCIQRICRWQSSKRLEASLPASAPVIVNTGRTILLLQQQWQVFKGTAVYTRMFYTAKQKIFLPVPSGFRQKQQTLNQHDSWAHRERQMPQFCLH